MKHMITRAVAHMTIPPCFWDRSACNPIKPNITLNEMTALIKKTLNEITNQTVKLDNLRIRRMQWRNHGETFCSCLRPSSTVDATF